MDFSICGHSRHTKVYYTAISTFSNKYKNYNNFLNLYFVSPNMLIRTGSFVIYFYPTFSHILETYSSNTSSIHPSIVLCNRILRQ